MNTNFTHVLWILLFFVWLTSFQTQIIGTNRKMIPRKETLFYSWADSVYYPSWYWPLPLHILFSEHRLYLRGRLLREFFAWLKFINFTIHLRNLLFKNIPHIPHRCYPETSDGSSVVLDGCRLFSKVRIVWKDNHGIGAKYSLCYTFFIYLCDIIYIMIALRDEPVPWVLKIVPTILLVYLHSVFEFITCTS